MIANRPSLNQVTQACSLWAITFQYSSPVSSPADCHIQAPTVETLEQPLSIRTWLTKWLPSLSCKKSGQKTTQWLDGPYLIKNWSRPHPSGRTGNSRAQSAHRPAKLMDYVTTVVLCKTPLGKAMSSLHKLKGLVPHGNNDLLKIEEVLQLLNTGEDVPFDWEMINSMLSGEFWIILTAMSNVKPSRLMWFKASILPPGKIKHLNHTIKERKRSSRRRHPWQFKKTYLAWSF